MRNNSWLKVVLLWLWLMPWIVQAMTTESFNINSDLKVKGVDICDTLSLPLQGIEYDSVITISNNVNIQGLNDNILGFSKGVFNSGSGDPEENSYCNGNRCVINPDKQVNKINLPVFDTVGGSVISSWGDKNKKIFPGKYTDINIGQSNIIFSGGDYFIDKLSVHTRSEITIEGNVRFFIKEMSIGGSNVNMSGKSSDFQVFIYDSNTMAIVSNNAKIKAYIYSESERPLQLTNTVEFYGSIIARKLEFNATVSYVGENSCEIETKPIDFELLPNDTTFLTCEMVPIVINVLDGNGNLNINYNGEVSLKTDITQSNIAFWMVNDNRVDVTKEIKVNIKKGQGSAVLKANMIADIKVFAQIKDIVKSNRYKFVPYKFHAESQRIIAGKPKNVDVSVLSCNNNLVDVETSYSGVRNLNFKTEYISPSTKGNGIINVRNKNIKFESGKTSLNIMYPDSGIVNLIITDPSCTNDNCTVNKTKNNKRAIDGELTGSVSIFSRPWTFAICPQGSDRFTGTTNSGDGLVAAGDTFVMRSKPLQWQAGDKVNNSIDVSDDKYCQRPITPNFFAQDAPVATVTVSIADIDTPPKGHQGKLTGKVAQSNTELHDNTAMIFNDLRWSEVGSVKLAMTADSYLGMTINPSQRAIGRFYPKKFELIKSDIINAHIESTPFTYMDQTFTANAIIEAQNAAGEATLNYGKFAPQLKESLLLTAVDLNQNRQLNDVSARLDQSNLVAGWQHDWQQAQLTINDGALTFKRLPKNNNNSAVTITIADGPFKVGLGLSVLPRSECLVSGCTDFANKTQSLQRYNQPQELTTPFNGIVDSRYGRMVLSDVNGVFNQPLTMPLKVEYWNGDQFTINPDDSRSHFNSQLSCKQMIYDTSKPHDKAHLMATSGHVVDGKSYALQVLPGVAENEAYLKQQWRFWLRIAAQPASNISCTEKQTTNQPWLTFNWRGVGDEDPSALVTFGSYRGNDRIIYRAEKASINP